MPDQQTINFILEPQKDDLKKIDLYEIHELEKIRASRKIEKAEEKVARLSLLGDHLSRVFALRSKIFHTAAEHEEEKRRKNKLF